MLRSALHNLVVLLGALALEVAIVSGEGDNAAAAAPNVGIAPVLRTRGKHDKLKDFFRRDEETGQLRALAEHEFDKRELMDTLTSLRQLDALEGDEGEDEGEVLDVKVGEAGFANAEEAEHAYYAGKRRSLDTATPKMGGYLRKRALEKSTLGNYFDNLYYTNVLLGTPGTYYSVVLDTGSADLYVPSSQCSTTVCGSRKRYNPHSSSTSVITGASATVTYGSGQASGSVMMDRMAIGGLNIPQQIFIAATKVTGHQPPTVDGLMGLSFSAGSWANYNVQKTFKGKSSAMENLWKAGTISQAAFGMWLEKTSDAAASHIGGEIAIGSSLGNPVRYKTPITWLSVPGTGNWWNVQLDDIKVAGQSGVIDDARNVRGVVDSGTALIVTDYATAKALNLKLGAYDSGIRGIWGVNCGKLRSSTVKVVFTLQGHDFTLTGADMPVQVYPDDKNLCYAPFMSAAGVDVTDRFILGEVFLRKHYAIYDYNFISGKATPRVGLAVAV